MSKDKKTKKPQKPQKPDQPEELGPLAEHRKEQAEILAMALRSSAHPLK